MKISTKVSVSLGPVALAADILARDVSGGASNGTMPKSIADTGARDQYGNTQGFYYKHDTTHAGYRDLPPEMHGAVRDQGANRRDHKNAWSAFGNGSPRPEGWRPKQ